MSSTVNLVSVPIEPPHEPPSGDPITFGPGSRMPIGERQWWLAGILTVIGIGSATAWALSSTGLSESGLFFIAVPGSMAILMTLLPHKRGGHGGSLGYGAWRGTSIVFLSTAMVIREGFICVMLASPLIILVVVIVDASRRAERSSRQGTQRRYRAYVPLLLLLVASFEGVIFELPSSGSGSETRTYDVSVQELEAALGGTTLPAIEPLLFQLPFPKPTGLEGEGTQLGSQRIVHFDDAQWVLEVDQRTTNTVRWAMVEDSTPIARWMDVHHVEVGWTSTPEGLRVRVDVSFDRRLAPAAYFGPLEGWGAGELAEVLSDMIQANLVQANLVTSP